VNIINIQGPNKTLLN